MNHEAILPQVSSIIRDVALSGPVPITRSTKAMDVRGWDSLSHTMILLQLEDCFSVRFPMERVLAAGTVGDLVDLIAELRQVPVSPTP